MSKYTSVTICPETGEQVMSDEVYRNMGICARCGHDNNGAISHYRRVVGHWEYPSLWDRIVHGRRPVFVEKNNEIEA